MCLLLCANPSVNEWLGALLVRADRQSRQQLSVLVAPPPSTYEHEPLEIEADCGRVVFPETASRYPHLALRLPSPYERHKSLNALADAWSRLLIFVGWRR
jgi:hypothetical protein